MKKILINTVTVSENGVSIPWLLKFKEFQRLGYEISFNFGSFIKSVKRPIQNVYFFNKRIKGLKEISAGRFSKVGFIFYALKRNFVALRNIKDVCGKYEIVYSPSSVLDLVIYPFILKKMDKKIVWVTVLDNLVPITDPGNKIIRFLAWLFFQISILLVKSADHVFVISEDLKNYLIKRGFGKEKITVTGNGIEAQLIKKAKINPKYSFDALFIGRINETKGIYDMLKVLSLVVKKYPDFQLAIMGNGDVVTEAKFKKKIEAMGLKRNVKFLGFIVGQKKYDIIKSSKTFWFLSKSKSESFGVALLEVVCLGKKAFAYNLPPYRNIYKNNEVFVFEKNDFQAVAKAVLETFKNRNFKNPKGIKLLDKYSWEKIAQAEADAFSNCRLFRL